MLKDTILGFVRHALTFGGGSVVTSGLATQDEVNLGIGSVLTLLGLAWSMWNKRSA